MSNPHLEPWGPSVEYADDTEECQVEEETGHQLYLQRLRPIRRDLPVRRIPRIPSIPRRIASYPERPSQPDKDPAPASHQDTRAVLAMKAVMDLCCEIAPKGGALGGLCGYGMTRGTFRPLPEILREMSPEQNEKLFKNVMQVLKNQGMEGLTSVTGDKLISLVKSDSLLLQLLQQVVLNFVKKQLKGVFKDQK